VNLEFCCVFLFARAAGATARVLPSGQANDWGVFMSFADKLIQQAPISESGLHLGLVQFATNATLRQPLTGSKELFTQTSKTRLPRGKTNMAKAIDVVMQEFRDNGRRGTNKIALIFSDGLPSDRKATNESMRRAKEQGIKVVASKVLRRRHR
jgi:uncharacterized protein YegL